MYQDGRWVAGIGLRAVDETKAGARGRVRGEEDREQTRTAQARAELIMGDAMDKQSDAFAMLEIVQLSNGDIVLRDPDLGAEPLLRIQFSREVRTMLGDGCDAGRAS